MSNDSSLNEPLLAAPGKGLPKIELWMARLLVGLRAWRTSREEAAALFRRERNLIRNLVSEIGAEACARRILIKRLRGLEDSSRYWSVYMVLDHLRIVNSGTSELIKSLVSGEAPIRVVRTADVKPSPLADHSVVAEFEDVCARFEEGVADIKDLRTRMRWAHPWFGPLNAEKWHFFTAFHMGLHRRQIEAIKRGFDHVI